MKLKMAAYDLVVLEDDIQERLETFSTLEKLVILGAMGLLGAGVYRVDVSMFVTRIVWFLCQLKNLIFEQINL
jgi:hypothetical protein